MARTPGPYSTGSDRWPGLSRLAEEAAEVLQIAGKIIGGGNDIHDDGTDLRESLQDELGDLRAAIDYIVRKNFLDWDAINRRRDTKRALYEREERRAAARTLADQDAGQRAEDSSLRPGGGEISP